MENPGGWTQYWLCTGAVDSAGHLVYRSRTRIAGHVRGDSLKCLEWVWRESQRVTCEAAGDRRIVMRGGWTQGITGGTYRMILAEDEEWGYGLRPFIQWLEAPSASGPMVVRGTVALPVAVGASPDAELTLLKGRWHVTAITAIGRRSMAFELGPPNEFRQCTELTLGYMDPQTLPMRRSGLTSA
jgi:hypothetical protein